MTLLQNDEIIRIENTAFRQDCLDIRWRVTSMCNYQCDFCIQGDRRTHQALAKGENARTRMEICQKLRRLMDGLTGYDRIKLSLIGGEVTILKDFPQILEILAGCSFPGEISFDLTTNFSASPEYYADLARIIRECSRADADRILHITASYYSAYVSQAEFLKKTEQLLKLLPQERPAGSFLQKLSHRLLHHGSIHQTFFFSVVYPVLCDRDYEQFLSMRNALSNTVVPVRPLAIRNYETTLSPAAEYNLLQTLKKTPTLRVTSGDGSTTAFENIRALGEALKKNGSFCPRGCLCDAGIHNFWVNAFGDVYRCPAIGSDMFLGNLPNGTMQLLTAPAVCTSGHCSCNQFGLIERVPKIPLPRTAHPHSRSFTQKSGMT